MARDIQIPFGPDRTNGTGFEPLPPEGETEVGRDPFAEPPIEAYANTGNMAAATSGPAAIDAFAQNPASTAASGPGAAGAAVAQPVVPTMTPQMYEPEEEPVNGTISEEEATAQGMDSMQMSIAALRDSIGQGRELKAREKDYDELSEALAADHEELADRDYILENYAQVVGEQDAIIAEHTQRRDAAKAEFSQLSAQLSETTDALARMRDYHATQMKPLETDLGQTRATAEQAKNDERSRKSELNAAESELRRANDNDANTMAIAKHQQVQAAYDEAHKRSDQAKDMLAQVQRAYDDAREQAAQAEGPLERQIEDLENRTARLKEEISQHGEEISAARKRRQYCDTVYQYPEETARMHAEVVAAEKAARQMDAENEVLRAQLADSKQKSKLAKIAIAVVIVLIIVIVAAFIIVGSR